MSVAEMIYREITMLKLNSQIEIFSVEIDVEINVLESLGWDFDEYYSNTSEALDISMSNAIKYCKDKYFARIRVKGEEGYTSFTWVDRITKQDTEYEASGDDKKTVQDIVSLLNDGHSLRQDECENEKYGFVPFAI